MRGTSFIWLVVVACGDPTLDMRDLDPDLRTVHPAEAPRLNIPSCAGCTASVPYEIATSTRAPLRPWAQPISQYIAVGTTHFGDDFKKSIHDLAVFEDRMYFGYGDADRNIGRLVPIELRCFVDTSTTYATEEVTDEEEIDQFRRSEDQLFVPGIDRVGPSLGASLYSRTATAPWWPHALSEGLHVHDVTLHDGVLYVVGSGAASLSEIQSGLIFGYLWRSFDGRTFEVLHRESNDGWGDSRIYRILSSSGQLYLFGYKTGLNGKVDRIANKVWTGTTTQDLQIDHPLRSVLIAEAHALNEDRAILAGVPNLERPLKAASWQMIDGQVSALEIGAGRKLIDCFLHRETQEALFVTIDGDDWKPEGNRTIRIFVSPADRIGLFHQIAVQPDARHRPSAVAYWQRALFLGDDTGRIWRAEEER